MSRTRAKFQGRNHLWATGRATKNEKINSWSVESQETEQSPRDIDVLAMAERYLEMVSGSKPLVLKRCTRKSAMIRRDDAKGATA